MKYWKMYMHPAVVDHDILVNKHCHYATWGQGHWVKVKGHIDTKHLQDTPLSPDTSSQQISIKNLHSFRRYRAEGNFSFKVTESRSKVTSTRFFCATHLCPMIHPPTKYQPNTFIRLGDTERREFRFQGHRVKVKGYWAGLPLFGTLHVLYYNPFPNTLSSWRVKKKNIFPAFAICCCIWQLLHLINSTKDERFWVRHNATS
jgi:hypothetical protein